MLRLIPYDHHNGSLDVKSGIVIVVVLRRRYPKTGKHNLGRCQRRCTGLLERDEVRLYLKVLHCPILTNAQDGGRVEVDTLENIVVIVRSVHGLQSCSLQLLDDESCRRIQSLRRRITPFEVVTRQMR